MNQKNHRLFLVSRVNRTSSVKVTRVPCRSAAKGTARWIHTRYVFSFPGQKCCLWSSDLWVMLPLQVFAQVAKPIKKERETSFCRLVWLQQQDEKVSVLKAENDIFIRAKVSSAYLFFSTYYYFPEVLSVQQLRVNGLNSFSTRQSEACGLMELDTFKSLFTASRCTASFEINLLFLLSVYFNRNTFWRRWQLTVIIYFFNSKSRRSSQFKIITSRSWQWHFTWTVPMERLETLGSEPRAELLSCSSSYISDAANWQQSVCGKLKTS